MTFRQLNIYNIATTPMKIKL